MSLRPDSFDEAPHPFFFLIDLFEKIVYGFIKSLESFVFLEQKIFLWRSRLLYHLAIIDLLTYGIVVFLDTLQFPLQLLQGHIRIKVCERVAENLVLVSEWAQLSL